MTRKEEARRFCVAVLTGTRAEYGLLRPVLQKMDADVHMDARLVVTGAHLAAEYGHTVEEIEADGRPIAARIDILSQPVPGGRAGTARRTVLALEGLLAYFNENPPDALLLLGDRYEAFAGAQAAALLDIPVVHISGGDVTFGADDDWFRHCITKMAKLHFPSCEVYRQRVIRMGEAPQRVFNVGGLGAENIRTVPLLSRDELAASLGVSLAGAYALVTFHPQTAGGMSAEVQADALLEACEKHDELTYLFTKANADAGGEAINRRVAQFCESHANAALFASLGVQRYLSAMRHAALVLGNSSSGIVETPSFGTPCVNVGARQAGRLMSGNILCCETGASAIAAAMTKALSADFAAAAHRVKNPYDGGDTSGKIVSILGQFLASGALQGPKIFYDAGEEA